MNKEKFYCECAKAMINHGLSISPNSGDEYFWEILISGIRFNLKLDSFDYSFINLPKVTLIDTTLSNENVLTHVNPDRTLCYLDTTGKYLDPFKPYESLSLILFSIKKTLQSIVDQEMSQTDFQQEFDSYWNAQSSAYLLDKIGVDTCNLYKYTDLISLEEKLEYGLYNSQQIERFDNWKNIRCFKESLGEHSVINISLSKPLNFVNCNESNNWPPSNWEQFYFWFSSTQGASLHSLLEKLSKAVVKSLTQTICFEYTEVGQIDKRFFAVRVKFHRSIQPIAQRYSGRGSKKKKLNLNSIRTAFAKTRTTCFQRLKVIDNSLGFVLKRNLIGDSTLENKQVVIIGAGTIGSRLADMLVKIGAGTGSLGKLTLIDDDYLKPANLSRHLLDEKYLGYSKVLGVKHYLGNKYTWPLNLKALELYANNEQFIESILKSNDLVIDATGIAQFSTSLSYFFRGFLKSNPHKEVSILYSWVDANGLAVRTLLDDGKFACYRCLQRNENGKLVERFPLKGKGEDWPSFASVNAVCGESFTPYGEGVSSVIAGVAQSHVIDYLSGNPHPRFRHYSLHSSVPYSKSQNVKQSKECPGCNA